MTIYKPSDDLAEVIEKVKIAYIEAVPDLRIYFLEKGILFAKTTKGKNLYEVLDYDAAREIILKSTSQTKQTA